MNKGQLFHRFPYRLPSPIRRGRSVLRGPAEGDDPSAVSGKVFGARGSWKRYGRDEKTMGGIEPNKYQYIPMVE